MGDEVLLSVVNPDTLAMHANCYGMLEANVPEELCRLLVDPEGLTILALDPKPAATVRKLRDAAVVELRRTGAKMVDSLPLVQK